MPCAGKLRRAHSGRRSGPRAMEGQVGFPAVVASWQDDGCSVDRICFDGGQRFIGLIKRKSRYLGPKVNFGGEVQEVAASVRVMLATLRIWRSPHSKRS